MQKVLKDYGTVLKQKLISIELLASKNLADLQLDYFSTTTQEAAKLVYRLNNCWLLSDMCKDIFRLLSNYEVRFGPCHNKLRLILDLLSIAYKLSFIFVSDGSFSEKLKVEVLGPVGTARAHAICEASRLKAPYTLERHGTNNVLDVIRIFTEALADEEKTF